MTTGLFLSIENPQLGWGFRKAFSYKSVIKTPFDLLKHLAVWQLQKLSKKLKGGPMGDEKSLAHARWNCKLSHRFCAEVPKAGVLWRKA